MEVKSVEFVKAGSEIYKAEMIAPAGRHRQVQGLRETPRIAHRRDSVGGAEIITVAIRRTNIGQEASGPAC
jgi:thiazole synthase ThiGH ThiG subunit